MAGNLEGGFADETPFVAVEGRWRRGQYLSSCPDCQGSWQDGRFDEDLRTIDESFPIIERTGQRFYEAEVHRLRGELLLAQDASNAAQAEESFRTAIEILRRQKAKSCELCATTSLARSLRDTNRRDEARAMLADIDD